MQQALQFERILSDVAFMHTIFYLLVEIRHLHLLQPRYPTTPDQAGKISGPAGLLQAEEGLLRAAVMPYVISDFTATQFQSVVANAVVSGRLTKGDPRLLFGAWGHVA